jgi:predicted  nucleic acid-binding Zn-ribbon protein
MESVLNDVSFELVHKDIDLECPICTEVIYLSPQQVLCCKKHFCEACIKKNIKRECPLCRHHPLRYKDASRDFINRLYSAKVWCPNKKNGCSWIGQLATIEYHLYPFQSMVATDGCIYQSVDCTQCDVKVLRGNLLKHELLDCSQSVLRKLDKKFELVEKKLKGSRLDVNDHANKQLATIREELMKVCSDAVSHLEGTEFKLRTEILAQKEELRQVNGHLDKLEVEQEDHKRKLVSFQKNEVAPVASLPSCECSALRASLSDLQNQVDLLKQRVSEVNSRTNKKLDNVDTRIDNLGFPYIIDQLRILDKEYTKCLRRLEQLQCTISQQNHYINLYRSIIKVQQASLEAKSDTTVKYNEKIEDNYNKWKWAKIWLKNFSTKSINLIEAAVVSAIVFIILTVIYHVLI